MTIYTELKPSSSILNIRGKEDRKTHSNSYYSGLLDKSLRIFFWNAFKICARNPSQAYAFIRTVQQQVRASRVRADYAKQGIHVPPILLFSVTNRCNLRCKGCYNWSLRPEQKEELSAEKVKSIVAEAVELGISFVVLAGGEPLVRKEILDITASFPQVQFLIFTNGILIDDNVIATLERHRNIVPVISLEGNQLQTDNRRGIGVYANLKNTVTKLKKKNIFWSTSLTVTRTNISTIAEDQFIKELNDLGCQLFFLVEYTPVDEGTEEWVITDEQRLSLSQKVASLRNEFSALFVSVPGDEEEFGGCLAAGRGFIHISADGNVEPCPFVPFSDMNLKNTSLKNALQSNFLKNIRENSDKLEEGPGGCALWNKQEWLNSVLLHPGDTNACRF